MSFLLDFFAHFVAAAYKQSRLITEGGRGRKERKSSSEGEKRKRGQKGKGRKAGKGGKRMEKEEGGGIKEKGWGGKKIPRKD